MRGKCRVFLRKRYTFPRGLLVHRLHRPLSLYLAFPPPGKVPGFSAKTVHFPPWPTGVPAPQASLAALAVSPSRESAGFSCENGSLSPWPTGVPAPQASLAALAVSPSRESAGNFGENGSLSPVWCSYEALPPLCGGPLPLEPRAASLFSLLEFS